MQGACSGGSGGSSGGGGGSDALCTFASQQLPPRPPARPCSSPCTARVHARASSKSRLRQVPEVRGDARKLHAPARYKPRSSRICTHSLACLKLLTKVRQRTGQGGVHRVTGPRTALFAGAWIAFLHALRCFRASHAVPMVGRSCACPVQACLVLSSTVRGMHTCLGHRRTLGGRPGPANPAATPRVPPCRRAARAVTV